MWHAQFDVRAGVMNGRMDAETGQVDQRVAFHNLTGRIDQDEVVGSHFIEEQAKRIDPEVFGSPRHAEADVSGHSVVESGPRQESIGGRQLDLLRSSFGRVGQSQDAIFLSRICSHPFNGNRLGIDSRHSAGLRNSREKQCQLKKVHWERRESILLQRPGPGQGARACAAGPLVPSFDRVKASTAWASVGIVKKPLLVPILNPPL